VYVDGRKGGLLLWMKDEGSLSLGVSFPRMRGSSRYALMMMRSLKTMKTMTMKMKMTMRKKRKRRGIPG
jgi:hypothetical protein